MRDPISKDMVDNVFLDADLIGRIRAAGRAWCRRTRTDQLVHVTYMGEVPRPVCRLKGRQQPVDLELVDRPVLCGPCHRRLGQIGALL